MQVREDSSGNINKKHTNRSSRVKYAQYSSFNQAFINISLKCNSCRETKYLGDNSKTFKAKTAS